MERGLPILYRIFSLSGGKVNLSDPAANPHHVTVMRAHVCQDDDGQMII